MLRFRLTVRRMMAAVAIVALLLIPLTLLGDRSMTFELINHTSGVIRDVDLTVGGQRCRAEAIPAGASAQWVIYPTSYRYGTPFGLEYVARFRDPYGRQQENRLAFGSVFDARGHSEPASRMEITESTAQLRTGGSVIATPMSLSTVSDRVTPWWRRLLRTYLSFGR